MNWDAISAIGEMVAAIAVVITLVFLVVQLRLSRQATDANTKVTRSAAAAQSQNYLAKFNEVLMANADLSKLYTEAFAQGSFEGLADDEVFRIQMGLRANMQHFEAMYFQFEEGLLEDRVWALRRSYIGSFIRMKPVSDWWSVERESSAFTEEFIADIESSEGFVMGELGQRVQRSGAR